MSDYTKQLTAEQLIAYIANSYIELSHDKALYQRNHYVQICREWLKHRIQDEEPSEHVPLNPTKYDF